MTRDDILGGLWSLIQQLKEEGQVHTKLSKSIIIVMLMNTPGLENSSEFTLMRGTAEQRYKSELLRDLENCSR